MTVRFKIRRSSTYTGAVSSIPLAVGEVGYIYSQANNPVAGQGRKLYVGTGTETNLQASTIEAIGGSYYTSMLDHVPGTSTANAAVLLDANKRIDEVNIKSNGKLNLFNVGNTFSTSIKSHPTLTANYDLVLPIDDGGANQVLTTDGSGNLSWTTVSNSAISLANNNATAFTLADGATNYLNVSTVTGSESISIGNSLTKLTENIKDNVTSAYLLKTAADNYIRVNTTDGSELVAFDTGNVVISNDLAINGGDLTSSATTFNLLNSIVTTLNIGGAASTVSIGAGSGSTTVNNNLIVTGNLSVFGSNTSVNTTSLTVEDAIIELGRVDGVAPTSNTGLDLGLKFNYYTTALRLSAIYWKNTSGRFVVAGNTTETTGTLSVANPTSTINDYAGLELGSLFVNDFASTTLGTAEVVLGYATINGTAGRHLQNCIVDGGVF